ncbi:MAG: cadherin repeat domain-containing protein [Cyanobacteria bacterium J06626_6]
MPSHTKSLLSLALSRHLNLSVARVLSVPILVGLGSCQNSIPPSAEVAPSPTVLNTAEVYSPNELTIISPKNTLPGNSTLIQVAENSTDVIQVRAQDTPGSKLVYRLQDGEDMDKFLIDKETGNLTFKEVPDWEQPGDANQDNNYMLLWQVVSSSGGARSQFMIVKVTDLPD